MIPGSLRRRLATLFVVAGLVGVVLVGLVAAALFRLDSATHERVDLYGPASLETETLGKAFSDQETGLRGFLVAGRDSFLEPYVLGQRAETRAVTRLQRLLRERSDLLRRLDRVTDEARSWRQTVAEPAIARVRAEGPIALSATRVQADKQRFDEVRQALADLRRPVHAARDKAGRDLNRTSNFLRIAFAVVVAGLLLMAVLMWQALQRWVVTPLQALGAAVERVETGDLSRKVEVDGAPAEIAALIEQVEAMRIRILQEYALAERARAEAEAAKAMVEEQAEDLRRSNAELEQFAYVASHDLQEPLRKVASFCQLLERRYKGQLDERGEQYIEFAVDGAKRMQQLINDLLAFSRVGRRSGELQPVDMGEVLEQAERQLATLIEEAGATVTHDPLPQVHGDPSLLVQLMQNLVGNGIKFRSARPPHVHVGVSATNEAGDGMVELYCRDNGIGIEAQYEDKIFVIFQRLHGRDTYSGTGIGLAMCKKIVEFHGGRLWLDTADPAPEGSTFRFTLPLAGATSTTQNGAVSTDGALRRTQEAAQS